MDVINTILADLPVITTLFDQSIIYQEKQSLPSWRNYDREAVINDILNKRQFKIVIDGRIAIVFSVCFSDAIIWREKDQGKSIYLHRIVVNPQFKGQRLFGHILKWTEQCAKERGLQNVRMDTWAANPRIIDYYKSFGFHVVENFVTPDSEELPVHNRKLALTLLEFSL